MLCANSIFKYYLKARCQHAACCICHWGWLRLGSLMSTKQAWHRSFILLTHLCCWIQQASNLVWSRLTCTRNQLWVESSGTLGWWFVNVQCSKTSSSDHVYHSCTDYYTNYNRCRRSTEAIPSHLGLVVYTSHIVCIVLHLSRSNPTSFICTFCILFGIFCSGQG